jgi:hypothetical protein
MDVVEALDGLGAALDEDGFAQLEAAHPAIAGAISEAVRAGVSPAAVRTYVNGRTGSPELARWCQQAAAHLRRQRDD